MLWNEVAEKLIGFEEKADDSPNKQILNEGQARSLRSIAARLPKHGVIVADEVGMGKTRIAASVARAVIDAGGRVAFILPPGLGAQWAKELRTVGIVDVPDILRSIGGFLDAWDPERSRPWYAQSTVMISHAFANWRIGRNAPAWRWGLLPVAWNHWNQNDGDRSPWGLQGLLADLGNRLEVVEGAAQDIASASKKKIGATAHSLLRKKVFKGLDWKVARHADAYSQDDVYRHALERIVGVGLGAFDLIVIDEAHKSRDEQSALSRLLDRIVIRSEDARRLALTATPVELDVSQWVGMLKRIGVDDDDNAIRNACVEYAESLNNVRLTWRTNVGNRAAFASSATEFQEALSPYVLRRDKREDEPVKSFMARQGETVDSYRRHIPITISPTDLKPGWLDAVIAAEGLSAIHHPTSVESRNDKRLRLTIGNGHGICAMIDEAREKQPALVGDGVPIVPTVAENARFEYWRNVIWRSVATDEQALDQKSGAAVLYEHPALLAAVEQIEAIARDGRKVLVFGRFTRPMKALEDLLNARAMLDHLMLGKDWPQSAISKEEEVAVDVAYVQKVITTWRRDEISPLLAQRHSEYSVKRQINLDKIHLVIDKARYRLEGRAQTVMAGAIADLLGVEELQYAPDVIENAAHRIIESLGDEDLDADVESQLQRGSSSQEAHLAVIATRVLEEYGTPRGGYARRMYGETGQHTRRNLQLKFNRAGCFPQVLIAQSQVGREGLNLHEQCRDVVLLHPEWNPGVVEQQIGRVDRLGSRWCRDFDDWKLSGAHGDAPRITIRPVMFKGTYDEHNWAVLERRWALLRGQLHGVIVPASESVLSDADGRAIAEDLNQRAPRLSPNGK